MMHVRSMVGVTLAFVGGACTPPDSPAHHPRVDAVFEDLDGNVPGCALGVVEDGELVYARGYGMASLEHRIPLTSRTVFRTGSVSKQFTAATVALAAESGALSLDDSVRRWIPGLHDFDPAPTIEQAIRHTSGIRDYLVLMTLKGYRNDDWYTDAEVVEVVSAQRELNFEPGSEFLYSNAGYFLLSQIIREATGATLREYAREHLFGPLGMEHTHFHDDHRHVVPLNANGYAPTNGGFRRSETTLEMVGDGGVYSSVEDLALWVRALDEGALGAALTERLQAPGTFNDGTTNPYAFGLSNGTYRGLRTVAHGGAFVGFRADITRFPDQGVGIVTLCNRADGAPSARALRVADVWLEDRLEPVDDGAGDDSTATSGAGTPDSEPETFTDPERYAGSFHSPELDTRYVFSIEDGELRLRAGRGIDAVVRRVSRDTLHANGLRMRFHGGPGPATGFELDAGRVQHVRFERISGS